MEASPIALAAVAVLVRTQRGKLEVFWVKRAPNLAFLGGFWAFPGGRVEPGDPSLAAAAARELEEETGVALRDLNALVPAGRTVTPPWASLRFDAAYFLIEAPADAAPDVGRSGGELVAGEWIAPARALELWSGGERLTSPVVVRALRALVPGWDGAAERLAAAAADAEPADALRAWDLAPGLAMAALRSPTIPPATHTNCFVVGGAELIVVDPGSPYPEEQAALDEALDAFAAAGRRVREVWVTHHHIDHIAGIAHLRERLGKGIAVAAHPRTAELVAPHLGIDRLLADGETVILPGFADAPERRLRALFTPGHTAGHHVFVEETTGFVLAGDLVAGVGTVVIDPDEGDMIAYLESLLRVGAEGPRALLPAHGPVLTEPTAKLAEYRTHRLWREARVVEALATGEASAHELVPRVYADVPAAIYPLAERSLLAHLVKLVREQRVEEHGGRFRLRRS